MKGLAQAARTPPMPDEMGPEGAPPKQQTQPLSEAEELDVDVAAGLMANTLLDAGVEKLQQAAQAGDPIPVFAGMLSTMVEGMVKRLKGTEMDVSPSVWLAENGAVDQTIDFIAKLVDLPEEVKNGIFSDTVDQLKLMGKREKAAGKQPPQQPPQGAPPMGQMDMAQEGGMQPNPMGGMPA